MYRSIVSLCGLLLPWLREVADTLHVADDSSQIVHIIAMTFRAFLQVTFVYMMTVIADGVRNVEGEVVAALGSGYPEQLPVLLFTQMFFQIHVQCRASGQMFYITATVQTEFIHIVRSW